MDKDELHRLVSALPRHPGIIGKERYLNAAVLLPLVEMEGQYHFLFEQRAAHIRQGGEISFPGGEYDPEEDESCRRAAVRETTEELGIDEGRIHVLGRLDTLVSPRGVTIDSFLAVLSISGMQDLTPNEGEVQRVFFLPVSWFVQNPPREYELRLEIKPSYTGPGGEMVQLLPVTELGLPPGYERTWRGMSHRIFVYQTPEAVIWGLTAELVRYIVHRLGNGR
jgi:8-oxo-dGTP pyrophosphatase MutT (NUDIX family)